MFLVTIDIDAPTQLDAEQLREAIVAAIEDAQIGGEIVATATVHDLFVSVTPGSRRRRLEPICDPDEVRKKG